MAGAVDLYSGSNAATGTNLYQVDKSPLAQVDEGSVESVIGEQASALGGGITGLLGSLIGAIIGVGSSAGPILVDVETFFTNLLAMLGGINPLAIGFSVLSAIENFISTMLQPTQWFTDLLSILGDPGGIGTGSVSLGALDDIPLLGPVVSFFGDIIATMETAFTGIPIVGTLVEPVFTVINGLLGIGTSAQTTATTANTGVNGIIDSLIGVLGGTSDTGNAITGIANFLSPELTLLHNVAGGLGTVWEDIQGSLASLEGRVSAVETTQAGGSLVAGFDPCSVVLGNWATVSGLPALTSDGSSILSTATAAGIHTPGPATILHGITFQIARKQAGVCRGIICSDDAMDNYLGLEIFTGGFGNDYARLCVGSAPDTVIELAQADGTPVQWSGDIHQDWVWSVYYSNYPLANTFYVTRNGTPMAQLQYTDTGNLVTHGGTKIQVGWVSNCNSDFLFKGCAVTSFNYADLPV